MTLKLSFLILKDTENQSSQTYTLENAKIVHCQFYNTSQWSTATNMI